MLTHAAHTQPVSNFLPEKQITHGPGHRILTNTRIWSPDSSRIVYDVRPDAAGEVFDGSRIEVVDVQTGRSQTVYQTAHNARCGVATFHPHVDRVVFIHGPENPTPEWSYGPFHRQGVFVDLKSLNVPHPLDARDLTPPFTAGALRGGSHVHVWHAAGDWVSFTYEDHTLSAFTEPSPDHDLNQRNIGVSIPNLPVRVSKDHPRNHDGECFTVLVTRTHSHPIPGSDQIKKAYEEGWVGTNGYLRPNGSRQARALAFLGQVVTPQGITVPEVFIADLPSDLTQPGDGPLAGTATRLPSPPKGVVQRRLTDTTDRRYPGVQGIRHWLRVSPNGEHIACLMKDDAGVAQIWSVSPNGGPPRQITHNPFPISSAFDWSPDGKSIAHTLDNSVCVTDLASGITTRLTPKSPEKTAPRPEACVFSPDGSKIAFIRRLPSPQAEANQICVVQLKN